MEKWLRVKTTDFLSTEKEKVNGVELELGISPYDVPVEVNGNYEHKSGIFIIKFRYIDSEEKMGSYKINDFISFEYGAHSGRIQKMFINVKEYRLHAVALRICPTSLIPEFVQESLGKTISNRHTNIDYENATVVKGVLQSKQNELFDALANYN